MQTDDFKEKTKNTIIKEYGCDFYSQTDEFKEKFLNTVHKKYGENINTPSQAIKIKEKIRETNLKRYGVNNPMQNDDIKEKLKMTMINKYGVEHYAKTDDFKEKYKNTCLNKYGVEHSSKSNIVQKKIKATNIEKYGVPCVFQNPNIKEKISTTLSKNEQVKTSSQQVYIYEFLKNKYSNIEKNYPCDNSFFDIALFVDDVKIDIEYDGWYWHQDKQRDRRRDEFFKNQGWKILRIRSGHKLPTEEQLFQAIDELLTTDRQFKEIILDDWKTIESESGGEKLA